MITPKFQIGDMVEFTYDDNGSKGVIHSAAPSGTKKGLGIIFRIISGIYGLQILNPNYMKGITYYFSESALSPNETAWFHEEAPCPAKPSHLSPAPQKPKPEWNERAFFIKEKPDPNNPIPICPECHSKTTRPVRTIYCTKCEWKMEP